MTAFWFLPLGVGTGAALALALIARRMRAEALRLEDACEDLAASRRRVRGR